MDIIDRLRDGVIYVDTIDDAVAEIERLRRELAEAKRPPDGTVPFATRTEHKRPALDIPVSFPAGRRKLFKEE